LEIAQKNQEIENLKKQIAEQTAKTDELNRKIENLEGSLVAKDGDISRIGKINKDLKNEETERLAIAAQKTIQTLQSIINDKNKEIERYYQLTKKIEIYEIYILL
jgi:predicted RNase H-like nuclease (RuvC/YqgF family)